jgi:GT2 family glycosyltransferase
LDAIPSKLTAEQTNDIRMKLTIHFSEKKSPHGIIRDVPTFDENIAVVIPTFDAGILLSRAIESIRQSEAISNVRTYIIVVDNHPKSIDSEFAHDANEYIALPSNPGFGSASNAGFEAAFKRPTVNWVLLLNPDAQLDLTFFTELTSSNSPYQNLGVDFPIMPMICFEATYNKLLAFELFKQIEPDISYIELFDHEDTIRVFYPHGKEKTATQQFWKVVHPEDVLLFSEDIKNLGNIRMRYKSNNGAQTQCNFEDFKDLDFTFDQIVQNAGSRVISPFSAGDLETGSLASSVESTQVGFRNAWCGAAVLLPRSYIVKLGGFDESFFLYYEDTEFSVRGWEFDLFPYLFPKLRVHHHHSAITSKTPKLRSKAIIESRILFIMRTSNKSLALLFTCLTFARYLSLLILGRTSTRHFVVFFLSEIKVMVGGLVRGLRIKPKTSLSSQK